MRKNGLSRPYSPLQVATWVTLPTLVLQFLFFVSPLLPLVAAILCTLLYFCFVVASVYNGYKACATDPIDPLLAIHLNEGANGQIRTASASEPKKRSALLKCIPIPTRQDTRQPLEDDAEETTKHCWVCDIQVHEHAMHCKYCDKCVAHFDHHCQWLNTCVGEANYPYFYATLWSITAMLFIHISIMIALVIDNFLHGGTEKRADEWFNANASVAVTAVNIFFIIFCGIALSLVVQLLVFHLGLRKEGLTTYQYILRDSARTRERKKIEAARKQKRVLAVSKAKSEGKYLLAYGLMMGESLFGKVCPCCDPLPREQPRESESNSMEEAQQRPQSMGDTAAHPNSEILNVNEAGSAPAENFGQVNFVPVSAEPSQEQRGESKEPEGLTTPPVIAKSNV